MIACSHYTSLWYFSVSSVHCFLTFTDHNVSLLLYDLIWLLNTHVIVPSAQDLSQGSLEIKAEASYVVFKGPFVYLLDVCVCFCHKGVLVCFVVHERIPVYALSPCWQLSPFKLCCLMALTPRKSGLDCFVLTLKVLNFWKFTSYCSLKPLWSGMGEVVPARTSPTLHPPSPPTVHQLSWLAL